MRAVALLLAVCAIAARSAAADGVRDDLWARILRAHVNISGDISYRTLATRDRRLLERYIESLADVDIEKLERSEVVAFWLNAYHAVVVSAVVHGEVPETIDGRARLFHWYRERVAGAARTPDQIEAELAPYAKLDPRIHLARSNATRGGPRLGLGPYDPRRLDDQLQRAAKLFANNSKKNRFDPTAGTVELSRVFEWYRGDFEGRGGSLLGFLEPLIWSPTASKMLDGAVRVEFLEFDWTLNAKAGERLE